MDFLLFALSSYGLCFGVMNDKIPFFPLLREVPLLKDSEGKNFFSRMFECPYCTGFHAGWIIWAALNFPPTFKVGFFSFAGEAIYYGFAASAFCYVLDTLVLLVEAKTHE